MNKYIDADPDHLREMIVKYQSTAEKAYNPSNEDADFWYGKVVACEDILHIFDSLYQKQPESRIMTREMIEGRLLQNDTESWNEDYNEEDLQTRFAFYTYKDEPGVLYLSNLFVEEASRNRGLGTKILKAAEKVAETIGASSIGLRVKQDSPVNAWYRKNGYGYVASDDGYDWLEKILKSV